MTALIYAHVERCLDCRACEVACGQTHDLHVPAIGSRLVERRSGALGIGFRGGDVRLRLQDLPAHRSHL